MDRRWLAGLAALLLLGSLTGCLAQDGGSVDVSDDEESEELGLAEQGAFLIARKYLPGKDMVKGRSTVVVVEVHNVGSSTAYDVVVKDLKWQPEYFTVGESMEQELGKIPAGGTAKAEFSVTPLDVGSGTALGATVTYKRQEGASEIQTAESTPVHLGILTSFQLRLREALRWGAYLTLGHFTAPQHWRNAAIIVTVFALGGTGLWAYSTVTETQKRQKYERAYADVQKMK